MSQAEDGVGERLTASLRCPARLDQEDQNDIQNISTVGWYRAPDIQRARLERRRRLVGGVGQAREAAEALVELVRRRAGAVLVNASA